ncbi:hypothetical protein [Streptomyces sp. NPDC002588]|uniref:hypothetical protein n=1 Tax=Streptomyces sp. NPDC002588 TaxID=3154419 RepID=UPI00332DA004
MDKYSALSTGSSADTTAVPGTRGTKTGDRGARIPVLTVAVPPRKLTRADFVLVN